MNIKAKEKRNVNINEDYIKGMSITELSEKYNLSKRTIERVIYNKVHSSIEEVAKVEKVEDKELNIIEDKELNIIEDKNVEDGMDVKKAFWNTDNILKEKANYYIVLSNRAPGKTYGTLMRGLKRYVESGYKKEVVYIRRYDEDLKPSKGGGRCYNNILKNGEIAKLTDGKWNSIKYRGREWYLSNIDEDGNEKVSPKPFCYGLSIYNQKSQKSGGFPDVRTIITDEFIEESESDPQIFQDWQNLINTIVRKGMVMLPNGRVRKMTKEEIDDYEIYLLGNIVNTESIFLEEMGLHEVINQKAGTICTYTYPNCDTKVRVEFIDNIIEDAPTNVFFEAFRNGNKAIIGTEWEIPSYPKKPLEYDKKDILSSFFIEYGHILMKCDIIEKDDKVFIFVTKKTTPLKYPDDELIYSQERSPAANRRCDIFTPETNYERKILTLINTGRVYFQSNEVGNKFYNYLKWCKD